MDVYYCIVVVAIPMCLKNMVGKMVYGRESRCFERARARSARSTIVLGDFPHIVVGFDRDYEIGHLL